VSPHRALARLQKELRVIGHLGLADYFLVVADIVGFAASQGIPTSGRGSGASSLVAYLLGITQVDPIEHGLLFERFLNEHRPDYPDLDIDIAWRRRDEVIDYVYRRYGKTKVAMISTRACFELRSAAREVAKTFGLSAYEAQSLASRLPRTKREGVDELIRVRLGEIKPELPAELRQGISEMAISIVGFPHHSSVHCGGIVIADTAITDYTPLEQAAKGIAVTQFDMHAAEKIGLIKIDLLGNRALSVIEEATRAIELSRGVSVRIPPDDPATAGIMRAGHTLSCFQLESPAMRNLLAMLRAGDLRDATLAVALVRPGPSAGGMKEKFIRGRLEGEVGGRGNGNGGGRGNGGRGVEGGNGNGSLPVYEEDVMRIIARYTGMSLGEADILRRELKDGEVSQKHLERRFLFLADTTGVSKAEARKAWEHVHRFAAYTFCKAHACSFGILAYAAAYLKANFPLEFYAATLRNHSGMYPVWAHANEARRVGIGILLPSVNRSKVDFSIEGDSIRTGLVSIKHMSQKTTDAILAERRRGPFVSLEDFLARVAANRDETAAMIASGAFDDIEPERSSALAEQMAHKGAVPVARQPQLGLRGVARVALPTRPFTEIQKREMEFEVLGFSPLAHPLHLFDTGGDGNGKGTRAQAASRGEGAEGRQVTNTHARGDRAAVQRAYPEKQAERERASRRSGGRQATVYGLLAAVRHYKAEGRDLYFITLDNPERLTECILPRECLSLRLELGRGYRCRGRLRRRFGVTTLAVESIGSLPRKST
jgi:DNA-directed DNA polymerase III PolC